MTHICVSKLTIIGSNNGLSPDGCQAIIWTNARLLLIGPLGTNFSEFLIKILTFSFKKMRLKVSSAKRRQFCLGLNVLTKYTVPHNRNMCVMISQLTQTWLCEQQLVRFSTKELQNLLAFCEVKSKGEHWILLTKRYWCRKHFHVMISSWAVSYIELHPSPLLCSEQVPRSTIDRSFGLAATHPHSHWDGSRYESPRDAIYYMDRCLVREYFWGDWKLNLTMGCPVILGLR